LRHERHWPPEVIAILEDQLQPIQSWEIALAYKKIHNYEIFRRSSPEMRTDFLRMLIKIIKDDLQSSSVAGCLYKTGHNDICLPIPKPCSDNPIEEGKNISFLGKTVIAKTYEGTRLGNALMDITRDKFRPDPASYTGDYFSDWDAIIIRNGIHHSAAAVLLDRERGEATCDVYRISDFYPHMSLSPDFSHWITEGIKEPFPVADPRIALLYALSKEADTGVITETKEGS